MPTRAPLPKTGTRVVAAYQQSRVGKPRRGGEGAVRDVVTANPAPSYVANDGRPSPRQAVPAVANDPARPAPAAPAPIPPRVPIATTTVTASSKKPATTTRAIVQAAVNAGLIADTPKSREWYLGVANADQMAAVNDIREHVRVQAGLPVAPVPAGHKVTARPVTVAPGDTEGQYPSSWALPASQQAGQSGNKTRDRGSVKATVARAAGRIMSSRDTRTYMEEQRQIADGNRAQAQRRIGTHSDPHNLIAAAAASARAQQAAQQAELNRQAAVQARHYGR